MRKSAVTLKNVIVEPACNVPYAISDCSAKSSVDSIGVDILSTVRNAAKLAVYEETMTRLKNLLMDKTTCYRAT